MLRLIAFLGKIAPHIFSNIAQFRPFVSNDDVSFLTVTEL
ncbi:hypothetical protein GLO73106DRAFT_00028830 [Gloeocapsa sp. PCC 73106]|nr:hypothetical protein GLO73106DRAFT_00028830 [Gloeocapsa sp. PCC 73106]